jgi:hypothetical protein
MAAGCVIWGSNPGSGRRFSLPPNAQTGSGAHPASNSMGTERYFAGREFDHSPPSSAEVKKQ